MRNNVTRILAIGAVSAFAAAALAQGKVTGIDVSKASQMELQVAGSSVAKPQATSTASGKIVKYVFDAGLAIKGSNRRVQSGGLSRIAYGWLKSKPAQVYVQLTFDKPTETFATQTEKGWAIVWGEKAALAKSSNGASVFASREPFPDRLPPIEYVRSFSPPNPETPPPFKNMSEIKVTLIFDNTEVVQILKALALQANVNIVTAPTVAGKLTLALQDVSVKEALDFVTTMANLRYAQVGLTYVVTASDRFATAIQQIKGELDSASETRVITLMSGEGTQIKASVLKAIPQDTLMGRYEIVLPSEKVQITSTEKASSQQGASTNGAGGGAQGAGGEATTAISTTAGNSQQASGGQEVKDPYVVLVGPKTRLDEVERLVRDLDKKIVGAARLGIGANITTRVVPIYSSQVARIRDSVRNLVDRDPAKASFSINDSVASDVGVDNVTTLLLMSGPDESMDTLADFAKSLDKAICEATGVNYPNSLEDAQRSYEVVELKFVEPAEAAYELQTRVRGLTASLMPAPADPLLGGGTFERKKDTEMWQPRGSKGTRSVNEGGANVAAAGSSNVQAGGDAQSSGSGGGSNQSGSTQGTGAAQVGGAAQSAASGSSSQLKREMGVEPMRLLLRGTKAQLAEAKSLLSAMDVEPKSVAVEIRVLNLTKEEALAMGLDWSVLSGGVVQSMRINQGLGDTAATPGTISGDLKVNRTSFDILGTLDRLSSNQKLIARPNLLAINGKPASLFVGDKIQYIKTIQASQNGTTIEIGELNVGVELTVVPRIGDDGVITMDLAPSLTILKGFTPVPGGGNLPQTTERYAQSQVVMRSGDTVAIGGLIQDDDRKTVGGIPILKDLPLIGKLFSRTENNRLRTEVVFFITAKEVKRGEAKTAADPRENEKKNPSGNGG